MTKKPRLLSLVAFALFSSQLFASVERYLPPNDLMKKSPLVFEGEVTRVEYKNSKPNAQSKLGDPFTFVTYRVISKIRGQVGQTFTLRFMGGLNPKGIFMSVGNTPLFDVGDRDVLFVDRNTVKACPLVSCEAGRLRLIQDRAYLDNGRTLRWMSKKKVGVGRPQQLVEIRNHTLVHPTTGQRVEIRNDGSTKPAGPAETDQFRGAELITFLRQLNQSLPAPSGTEPVADIAKPFDSFLLLAKTPSMGPPDIQYPPGTPEEQAETKALKANDYNPVITKERQ